MKLPRAERLLALMQIFRAKRYPITGQELARLLNISLRTLYRDILTLQSQGADIQGEAGVGYILQPGFTLPPLMFSLTEVEALVLGTRLVIERADPFLAEAAKQALIKIAAVMPSELKLHLSDSGLLVGPSQLSSEQDKQLMNQIRQAINQQNKLTIVYQNAKQSSSQRIIWPFVLGFFDQVIIVVAWCELRQQIRHFRLDRISHLEPLPQTYPKSRRLLLKEWRQLQHINTTDII